jgi:hypothetical protein
MALLVAVVIPVLFCLSWDRKDACWLSIVTRRLLPQQQKSPTHAFLSFTAPFSDMATYVRELGLEGQINGVFA